MDLVKIYEKKIIEQLEWKPLWQSKFIPKYKWCPKLCKRMNWGKWEYNSRLSVDSDAYFKIPVGTTVKFETLNGIKIKG